KGWKCDCPSIIDCISVIRSLNGRGPFHAISFLWVEWISAKLLSDQFLQFTPCEKAGVGFPVLVRAASSLVALARTRRWFGGDIGFVQLKVLCRSCGMFDTVPVFEE
ncbi:hypothetical protein QO004_005244, partial [Rhizobium mesoamericanum]|uniref:hypothetical protein n=1 Tax=Rhizobium mesoamericanum TaxID=1079800 RepID=UPI00278A2B8B